MNDVVEQIEKFRDFLEQNYQTQLNEIILKGRNFLLIDFTNLLKYDHELADQLLDQPEETIKAFELTLEHFDISTLLRIRFFNLPQSQKVKIKDIRSNDLGKFLLTEGIVRQSSDVRPQVVSAKFECPSCGNSISILQVDVRFKEPYRCTCGKKGRFRLLSKELVDAQRIVVEESPDTLEGGEQPKRLNVFLKEDLVEPIMEKKTTPGSKVRINGIVKEVPVLLKTGTPSTKYDIMMEANFIEPLEETFEELEVNKEDEEKILELSKNPKIYEKLVNSIAPSIYGHSEIKEALILQLFGGVRKERKDGTWNRGDIHILLVGDPGSAKSSLLFFMSKIAPKARYVSGKSASAAGLTGAIVKDEFLKGWALEAGALPLANGGGVFLDELDKMDSEDTSALHEGLEQQQITFSKANIQATLLTRVSALAAANPKLGRFDPYQPIAAQINLPPALINRFDLIFPMRDIPDEQIDAKIATHILEVHENKGTIEPDIESKFLKKYVSYAKKKILPRLTEGAKEEIKNFYVSLRNSGDSKDGVKPIPISARQLEALIRLSEASAKIRLSSKITKEDSRRAIRILRRCLEKVGIDPETGKYDIDVLSTGISTSQRGKIIIVREVINEFDRNGVKTIPIEDVINICKEKGLEESRIETILDQLKKEGEIFQPKVGFISKI
ncbi:MAG: minichromosome maintenance protein MCM [Nanoarchaeota archaeon]